MKISLHIIAAFIPIIGIDVYTPTRMVIVVVNALIQGWCIGMIFHISILKDVIEKSEKKEHEN